MFPCRSGISFNPNQKTEKKKTKQEKTKQIFQTCLDSQIAYMV